MFDVSANGESGAFDEGVLNNAALRLAEWEAQLVALGPTAVRTTPACARMRCTCWPGVARWPSARSTPRAHARLCACTTSRGSPPCSCACFPTAISLPGNGSPRACPPAPERRDRCASPRGWRDCCGARAWVDSCTGTAACASSPGRRHRPAVNAAPRPGVRAATVDPASAEDITALRCAQVPSPPIASLFCGDCVCTCLVIGDVGPDVRPSLPSSARLPCTSTRSHR